MKMIPANINRTISNAERKIFEYIKATKSLDEWYCLHSLGLSKHIYKREGEIDLLLVGPSGIFVIEVKGGRVRREGGVWKFTDRYGQVTEKRESPFEQARSAMYSLRGDLLNKFGQDINQYLFGYGVALPDIQFTQESPEWDLDTVFDKNDVAHSMSVYLGRLISNWETKQRLHKKISPKDIKNIVQYLRGDFEAVCPLNMGISDTESEILRLSDEQLNCLDAMAENARVIFQGGAGTGKTLLALEQARRNDALGIKTLVLCYNKFLAKHLQDYIEINDLSENVKADTVHGFFYDVIKQAGLTDKLTQENVLNKPKELYTELYPTLFKQAFAGQRYKSIIIDESQDVLTSSYIECLNLLIEGGFEGGTWHLFLDPENQKNIFVELEADTFQKLKNYSVTYKLGVNFRNTKPIALQTEIISGINTAKVKKVEGLPVKYLWYENSSEQAAKVSDAINHFLAEGVKCTDITILSPKRHSKSLSGSGRLRLSMPTYELKPGDIRSEDKGIATTTIQSFKGLESSIVILTDIDELEDDWNQIVNYVGFTRARSALVVSIHKPLKVIYKKRLSEILS